jgi:hypothetical protein
MTSWNLGLVQQAADNEIEPAAEFDNSLDRQAAISAALATVFRGKFCDLILQRTSIR